MLNVLHSSGETLCHGWPLVLTTIGAVSDYHGYCLLFLNFTFYLKQVEVFGINEKFTNLFNIYFSFVNNTM